MGRREFFVDTSAWFPIVLRKHPRHQELADELRKRVVAGERVVSTNVVVAETHALLLARGHRREALAFVQRVREAPNVIVYSTERLESLAVAEWLERYDDQDFSLADAVSFAVMKERRTTQVMTLDAHFAVAGFEMVPPAR